MSKPSPAHEIIAHPIAGQAVHQRVPDGYINATALCKAAGKRFFDYHRRGATTEFIAVLSLETGIPVSRMVQIYRGQPTHLQGTWVHPRVAIHLGMWLSPRFAVRVTRIVEDWQHLQTFLRPEPTDWRKRFPDKFWQEIYRLHGWQWQGMEKNRYQVVGKIGNDLVWDRLAPGLRKAIELQIPRRLDGEDAVRMHQTLTEEIGAPKLQEHIGILLRLMAAQTTWVGFMFAVNQALPKSGKHLPQPPKEPPSDQGRLDL